MSWKKMHRFSVAKTGLLLLLILGFVASGAVLPAQGTETIEEEYTPWRLDEWLGTPDWFRISGSMRLRAEGISGQFRANPRLDNSDAQVLQRTLLRADFRFDWIEFVAEGIDARQYGAGHGSFINTTTVSTLDLLQGYVQFNLGELAGGKHRIRAGRQTIDLGSRRLTARNRYRNTINAFTGIDWQWKDENTQLELLYTLPVRREPFEFAAVQDLDIQFDDEEFDTQFFGGFFTQQLDEDHKLEVYGLGLLANDGRARKRQLGTVGARLVRAPKKGMIDYQIEGAYQFGDSELRASGPELDHSAGFVHASVGYTFDACWSPRVRLAIDWASGDNDSNDNDNNRFDTLFGARRFEYGPTTLYGAIARSNILSPEVRLELKPMDNVNVMAAARALWLASDEDAWTTSGVADPTGDSGSFVGQQFETRIRWDVLPKSVRIETGAVLMLDGEFQQDAPGGQSSDTWYGYFQVAWTF